MSASSKRSSKTYIGIVIGVAIVLGILINAHFFYNNSSSGGGASYAPVYVPTQHTITIVNDMIRVNAHSYTEYTFSTPVGSTNAYLNGTFTAGGGSGNDIRIYILDEQNFINWRNGHQASTYYNSGQETVGNINANVPSGQTLYLVYDNSFSILSSKEVSTNVSLTYTS